MPSRMRPMLFSVCARVSSGSLVVYVGDGIGTTGDADPVAAISLYGPAYRLNPDDRPELGAALRDLVAEWAPSLLGA